MTVRLAHWPTPLDPAPRLAAALGLRPGDLVVERDDLTDLGGGDEVRELEAPGGRRARRRGGGRVVASRAR
ncbi:hypothetical protein ACI79J_14980 [Geodermatophilus sp. SYSU D01062]